MKNRPIELRVSSKITEALRTLQTSSLGLGEFPKNILQQILEANQSLHKALEPFREQLTSVSKGGPQKKSGPKKIG